MKVTVSGAVPLTDLMGEVDVGEHTLKSTVLLLHAGKRFVQSVADISVQLVTEVRPAGVYWHVEGISIVDPALGTFASLILRVAVLLSSARLRCGRFDSYNPARSLRIFDD